MLENITFSYFAEQVVSHPALLIAVLLTLGVILVNGWTDAPNAIATCVSTRCIDVDKAIIMAAACNFLGVLIMSLVNSKVAMTIKNMVNFGGDTDSRFSPKHRWPARRRWRSCTEPRMDRSSWEFSCLDCFS